MVKDFEFDLKEKAAGSAPSSVNATCVNGHRCCMQHVTSNTTKCGSVKSGHSTKKVHVSCQTESGFLGFGGNVSVSEPETSYQQSRQESSRSDDSSINCSEGTLRLVINNFRNMANTLRGAPKTIGGVPWKIMVMPRQHVVAKKGTQKCLGFFLQCCPDSYSDSWSCQASAELRLASQKYGVSNFTRKTNHVYTAKENDWGYSCFMTWADILEESQGYIKDEKVILEVFVRADSPKGILTHDSFVKKVRDYMRLSELQSSRGLVDKALEVNQAAVKFCKDRDPHMKDELENQKAQLIELKLKQSIERIEKGGKPDSTSEILLKGNNNRHRKELSHSNECRKGKSHEREKLPGGSEMVKQAVADLVDKVSDNVSSLHDHESEGVVCAAADTTVQDDYPDGHSLDDDIDEVEESRPTTPNSSPPFCESCLQHHSSGHLNDSAEPVDAFQEALEAPLSDDDDAPEPFYLEPPIMADSSCQTEPSDEYDASSDVSIATQQLQQPVVPVVPATVTQQPGQKAPSNQQLVAMVQALHANQDQKTQKKSPFIAPSEQQINRPPLNQMPLDQVIDQQKFWECEDLSTAINNMNNALPPNDNSEYDVVPNPIHLLTQDNASQLAQSQLLTNFPLANDENQEHLLRYLLTNDLNNTTQQQQQQVPNVMKQHQQQQQQTKGFDLQTIRERLMYLAAAGNSMQPVDADMVDANPPQQQQINVQHQQSVQSSDSSHPLVRPTLQLQHEQQCLNNNNNAPSIDDINHDLQTLQNDIAQLAASEATSDVDSLPPKLATLARQGLEKQAMATLEEFNNKNITPQMQDAVNLVQSHMQMDAAARFNLANWQQAAMLNQVQQQQQQQQQGGGLNLGALLGNSISAEDYQILQQAKQLMSSEEIVSRFGAVIDQNEAIRLADTVKKVEKRMKDIEKQTMTCRKELTDECERHRKEEEKLQKTNKQLSSAVESLNNRLDKLNQQLKDKKNEIKKLEKRIKVEAATSAENVERAGKIDALEKTQKDMQRRHNDETKKLQREVQKLLDERNNLQEAINDAHGEVDRLNQQLETRVSDVKRLENNLKCEKGAAQHGLKEALERAKKAELNLLEFKMEMGVTMCSRVLKDCDSQLVCAEKTFSELNNSGAARQSGELKQYEKYLSDLRKTRDHVKEMSAKIRKDFEIQISSVKSGKALQSLPMLEIPHTPLLPVQPKVSPNKQVGAIGQPRSFSGGVVAGANVSQGSHDSPVTANSGGSHGSSTGNTGISPRPTTIELPPQPIYADMRSTSMTNSNSHSMVGDSGPPKYMQQTSHDPGNVMQYGPSPGNAYAPNPTNGNNIGMGQYNGDPFQTARANYSPWSGALDLGTTLYPGPRPNHHVQRGDYSSNMSIPQQQQQQSSFGGGGQSTYSARMKPTMPNNGGMYNVPPPTGMGGGWPPSVPGTGGGNNLWDMSSAQSNMFHNPPPSSQQQQQQFSASDQVVHDTAARLVMNSPGNFGYDPDGTDSTSPHPDRDRQTAVVQHVQKHLLKSFPHLSKTDMNDVFNEYRQTQPNNSIKGLTLDSVAGGMLELLCKKNPNYNFQEMRLGGGDSVAGLKSLDIFPNSNSPSASFNMVPNASGGSGNKDLRFPSKDFPALGGQQQQHEQQGGNNGSSNSSGLVEQQQQQQQSVQNMSRYN